MKVVIDRYISFIEGVIEPYAETVYATPAQITPELVSDADALLVRTRTRVDATLLGASRCRFVATATIGMDHFDLPWCEQNGITAVNAPGCNAPAVAQYVMASVCRLFPDSLTGLTMAVVGVGNVGRLVEKWARGLGMNVMRVDPPRQEAEGGNDWHTLTDAARNADIITFHTPLTKAGAHPTFHLADKRFFESLRRKPIVINSSRGPVVDNAVWLQAITDGVTAANVIDVWEGEPLVDLTLMNRATISTPHIAGYSLDGKIRATQMVLDSFSNHFGLPRLKATGRAAVAVPQKVTVSNVLRSYNPYTDTELMRNTLNRVNPNEIKETFERLRDFYELRAEIS